MTSRGVPEQRPKKPFLTAEPATLLNSRIGKHGRREVYIAFVGQDKRLDSWISEAALGEEVAVPGPSKLPIRAIKVGWYRAC